MRILEEFWYGNIEPTEYDTSSCKEYKKLLELICRKDLCPSHMLQFQRGHTQQLLYRSRQKDLIPCGHVVPQIYLQLRAQSED